MLLSDLTLRQLASFIYNYERSGSIDGDRFTLSELLQESNRRVPQIPFGTVETARLILELANSSPLGLTTYSDIWKAFKPREPWVIYTSRPAVTNALERVGFYCISHRLPLIITLVIDNENSGSTSPTKETIYNYWVKRGFPTSDCHNTFIEEQQRLSREIVLERLPSRDEGCDRQ